MRNIFKPVFLGIAASVIFFSLAGCDNGTGGNGEPSDKPDDITVEVIIGSSPTVLRGGQVTFLAAVSGPTTDKTVKWSIDEENRHPETKIDINDKGERFLYVSEDETLETLTVRATSNADPEKSGTKTITVPVPVVDKVEISLPESWVVPWQGKVDTGKGGEIEFTVKVTGKDFIRAAVTWSIDNEGKKQGTTITDGDNGVAQLRVAQDETLTSFKVLAVSKWDANKVGEVTVTVKEPTVTGVVILNHEGIGVPDGTIAKPSIQIKTSDSEAFRAIVTGTGKVDQTVTWKIERLTYKIMVLIIQPYNGEMVDGWGEEELVIDLNAGNLGNTWVSTGNKTSNGSLIYEQKPIERGPGPNEVTIWFTNEDGNNEQKTLIPITGTTGIDADGKFTVDGQETFGKFRLTATPTADSSKTKTAVVQIDSSSEFGGGEPQPI